MYEKCRHILLPKDYLRLILTGEYATEVSDASGMQLLDVANRCWSDELLRLLQIDKALLGKVYESCEVTGRLTREMADTLGLCEGTVVVGGAGDNAAAAVGTGVVKDGKAFTTIALPAWYSPTPLPWQWTTKAEYTPAVRLFPTAGT